MKIENDLAILPSHDRRHPWKGNLTVETEIPSLEELLKKIEIIREEARTAMKRTKNMMKR